MEVDLDVIPDHLPMYRVFVRENGNPTVIEEEPNVDETEVDNFISDALECPSSLRREGPWKSKYFNTDIGKAVVHVCAIKDSRKLLEFYIFKDKLTLDGSPTIGMVYLKGSLRHVMANTSPVNIRFIHGLAFARYLYILAQKNDNEHLMRDIKLAATSIFKGQFPYEWIYYDFKLWAFAYTLRHNQIHAESMAQTNSCSSIPMGESHLIPFGQCNQMESFNVNHS